MAVYEHEIISSIFEEPTYGWGDRLKDWRAWFFSGIEVKMMILSYPAFILGFYFLFGRADMMQTGWIWLPFVLFGFSILAFIIGIAVSSMQDWLINQYKGDGIAAIEFEIMYADQNYGGNVMNVVMAERPFAEDPRSYELMIQDYQQRQRQLRHGDATDHEIQLNIEGAPDANFMSDTQFLSSDVGRDLLSDLQEKWNTTYDRKKRRFQQSQSDEEAGKVEKPAKGATAQSKKKEEKVDIEGDLGAWCTAAHPLLYGETIKVPRLGDFRKYSNMPIFERYMLDTGTLQPIFLKLKYPYEIGRVLSRFMIILSDDGSRSMGDLFHSPLRYIQLEGVFGKSPAYHSILMLVGQWRDIPIFFPLHTKTRSMTAANTSLRTQRGKAAHKHKFNEQGICENTIVIHDAATGSKTIKCNRTAQDVYMEILLPTVPTTNEIIAVSNQIELMVARFYYFTAQNLRHQLYETNILNANLIDAGTALDDMILETEGQIAKLAIGATKKISKYLVWIILIILAYLAGYFRWFILNLPILGTGGGNGGTNNTG